MKKIIALILASLICTSMFSGCCIVHHWVNSTCEVPQHCSECGKVNGQALGHNWVAATCTTPETCKRCGKTNGAAPGHNWTEETSTTPRICQTCQEMQPMKTPANGQVFIGSGSTTRSTLTIHSSTTQSCYIKLKDILRNDVYSFFVQAGKTAEVKVPGGNYYVYFAYGTQWYGPEYLFGPETTYAKDSSLCDFSSYSWEYTLTPVENGNFSQTPVFESEF